MRSHDAVGREWTVLGAAVLGFVLFETLGVALQFVASVIDRALYTNVTSSLREVLIRYRVWELYRALLYSLSAGFAGWVVSRVFRHRQVLAVISVVIVIGASLLISLFTGPGYYLRDLAIIAAIMLSPVVGGVWLQPSRSGPSAE